MPSASAFLDEPQAPSASAFLDEQTPTVADSGEGDGFLAKINAALGRAQQYREPLPEVPGEENVVQPEWAKAPEAALRELVGGMAPHDLRSYLATIYPPMAAGELGGRLAQGDISGIPLVGRVPEIMQADETQAFSKERYLTAMKTLMDVGALAGAGAEGAPSRLRTEPLVPEPPPTQSLGPGTIAGDVSRAVQRPAFEDRFTVPPDITQSLAQQIQAQQVLTPDVVRSFAERAQPAQPIPPPDIGRESVGPVSETAVEKAMRTTSTSPLLSATEIAAREPVPPPPIGTPLKPTPLVGLNGETPAANAAAAHPLTADARPEWIRQNHAQLSAIAEKSGVADKIEELHAQRLTAGQIAKQLGIDTEMVRAVRAERGLPFRTEEMQGTLMGGGAAATENPAFTKWVNERGQSPPPGAGAPEPYTQEAAAARAAQPVAPPQAVSDQPHVSAIANRFTEERAARGELGEVAPGGTISTNDLVSKGLQMGPERVNEAVSRIMQGGDITTNDAAAIRGEEARLSQRSNELSRTAQTSPEAQLAADNAFKDLTDFHNGPIAALKRNWHLTGKAMQGEIPVDLSTLNGLREAWFKDTGQPPPAHVEPMLRRTADRVARSISDEKASGARLGQEIERTTRGRRMPTVDEVRNNIAERMGVEPCIT